MADLQDRLTLYTRTVACILAGVPSTSFIPLPLTMALTRRFHREVLLKRLHFMVEWAAFCRRRILRVDLHVEGRENLPASTRGHMFVSNHQSWVDILIEMEALNTVAFLSKRLVRFIPVMGRCAYAGGTVFLDRKEKESRERALEEALRMCEESTAVVIYPEGTRSFDGELRSKIYTGGILAARARQLRVIPVGLDGTFRILPKTMDALHLGLPAVVGIGRPLDPADYSSDEAWVEAVWSNVEALYRRSRARVRGDEPPRT
jgi:1-acyl-sn-glycerol-3-phosphate acyltransferase